MSVAPLQEVQPIGLVITGNKQKKKYYFVVLKNKTTLLF